MNLLPTRSRKKITVSVIIPICNEAESLDFFFHEIEKNVKQVKLKLLFIDDGSTDHSLQSLLGRQLKDKRIHIIKLSRNFGKEAALTCGLKHCEGDVAIPIDVDLQDPIELIDLFLDKWEEGYDVVYGLRKDRKEDSFLKRFTANYYYKFFNTISDLRMPPNVGDFRLIDRTVIDELQFEDGDFTIEATPLLSIINL